jgi:hypothetical protein
MEFVEKNWWVIVGLVAVVFGGYLLLNSAGGSGGLGSAGKLDEFAKCISEKGAVFYGAEWCSHCKNQKEEFGNSFKYVNYVECSVPGGRGQVKECQDKEIKGYPTWEFGDGSRMTGEVPMDVLADTTGCQLPEGEEGN